MPLDKVFLYHEGAMRVDVHRRKMEFSDLVASIGVGITGKGMEDYLSLIEGKKHGDK